MSHMSDVRSSVDQVLPASLPQLREVSQENAQCSHSAVPGMGGEKVRHDPTVDDWLVNTQKFTDHAHKQNLRAELAASCKAHHAFLAKRSFLKFQHRVPSCHGDTFCTQPLTKNGTPLDSSSSMACMVRSFQSQTIQLMSQPKK